MGCTFFFVQFPVLHFGLAHSGSRPFIIIHTKAVTAKPCADHKTLLDNLAENAPRLRTCKGVEFQPRTERSETLLQISLEVVNRARFYQALSPIHP